MDDTASTGTHWEEAPGCPLCEPERPAVRDDAAFEPCVSVEGDGCSVGGCSPPPPTCDEAERFGAAQHSGGVEWVGSPAACAAGDLPPRALPGPMLLLVLLVLVARR